MFRRILALVTVLVLAPAALALGQTAFQAKTTHRDTSRTHVKLRGINGSTFTYTGTTRSSAFGKGKVRQRTKVNGLKTTGRFTSTYKHGKVRGRSKVNGRLSKGKVRFSGTYRITGGSGRYRGAKGKGTIKGTSPISLRSATIRQKGKVRY